MRSFGLESTQQVTEQRVPVLESFREVPSRGSLTVSGGHQFGGGVGMERLHECGQERLKQPDEEFLHGSQQVINVGQLENTLVGHLCRESR